MKILIRYKLALAGIALGSLLGYGFYYFIGCQSGQCPITSQPLTSTLYGALLGGISLGAFKK